MSVYLRRTPALLSILRALLDAGAGTWGLQLVVATGRPTGTVYPILERLERSGLVWSEWEPANARPGPRRRLYRLTESGRAWAMRQVGSEYAKGAGHE